MVMICIFMVLIDFTSKIIKKIIDGIFREAVARLINLTGRAICPATSLCEMIRYGDD